MTRDDLTSALATNTDTPTPMSYERLREAWYRGTQPYPERPLILSPAEYADARRVGLITASGRLSFTRLAELRREHGV